MLQRAMQPGFWYQLLQAKEFHFFTQGIPVDSQNFRRLNLVSSCPQQNLPEQRPFNRFHDQIMHIVRVVGANLLEKPANF